MVELTLCRLLSATQLPRLMKPGFTLLTLLLSLCCFAQSGALRIEPANVNKEVVVDDMRDGYQDITNITVTNTSTRTISLAREQTVVSKPKDWDYGTFSRRTETAPFIVPRTDADQDKPIRLAPGERATFTVVLDSDGSTGTGSVDIGFTDASAPGVTLGSATFTTRIVRREASPVTPPKPTSVKLYPNPAREQFFIDVPPDVRLGRVDVSNALGKRLLRFNDAAGKDGYNIEKLPDGLYLISIFDDRGRKLKTLRLLHRRFGA